MGFNIPAGWERINKSNTQRNLQKIGYSENVDYDYGSQNIFILYGDAAIKQLNAIAAGEKPNYIEQEDVETPIGTFKTYIEQRDEHSFTEYAFLPVDDTNGIYIFFAYAKDIHCHFYENGMPALLAILFNEKEETASLSDNYEYYLESYTYDGQTIFGVNVPDGYNDDYSEPTRLSFKSDSGNIISISEDPFLSPIYREATDIHLSAGINNPDIQNLYTYKNSMETPYGTVKI